MNTMVVDFDGQDQLRFRLMAVVVGGEREIFLLLVVEIVALRGVRRRVVVGVHGLVFVEFSLGLKALAEVFEKIVHSAAFVRFHVEELDLPVQSHVLDFEQPDLLLVRQRQTEETDRIERASQCFTLETLNDRFDLPVKDVVDLRLVALAIVVPLFGGELRVVGHAVVVLLLHVGLLPDEIEILVQTVQKERHELLRVLLRVAAELWRVASDVLLERLGRVVVDLA